MTWISNIIITSGAAGLLALGAYLAAQDKTATAGTVLGFGFLLVALLLLAKFKRIKGFGFEAEMWDEKQVQAAALVDKLTALATLTSEQVALISAKLGLWDAGFSNLQMAALMINADAVMEATDVPKSRRDEILGPIRDRIAVNYWSVARHITDAGLRVEMERLHGELAKAVEPERSALATTIQKLDAERGELNGLRYEEFKSVEPIHRIAKKNLASHDPLLKELAEIGTDLIAFQQNRKLRRDVDLSPLFRQNVW